MEPSLLLVPNRPVELRECGLHGLHRAQHRIEPLLHRLQAADRRVIAKTLEAATEGASLLAPRYEVEPARVGLDAGESFVPPFAGPGFPAQAQRGDVEVQLAAPKRTITQTYETPAQFHNPLEPHAF